MDSYRKIISDLKDKYDKDDNVLAFIVTGSVARGEEKQGNDLDTIFITKNGDFSKEYREDGILVETGGNTLSEHLKSLESNPMQVYMYLDAKAIFDKENCLGQLKSKAEEILRNYKPQEAEVKAIKKWLSSVVDKVRVAEENGDELKVGFHVSNVLWKTVEGLYAINFKPTPASTSALRRITELEKLPDNFTELWQKMLTGNLKERTASTLELIKFVLPNL